MLQDYIFLLVESELHEGTRIRGVFTDRYSAEEAMEKLKFERNNEEVFSYRIDHERLNDIF